MGEGNLWVSEYVINYGGKRSSNPSLRSFHLVCPRSYHFVIAVWSAKEAESPPMTGKEAIRLNMLVVLLCSGSLAAFVVGCYLAYGAIHGIAASQSH